MSSSISFSEKEVSQTLKLMIKNCASNLVEFLKCWEELKLKGEEEGFTEKELQGMVVDAVRSELKEQGFSNRQITNKIFNLFHKEERANINKAAYEDKKSLINKTDYHNNDTEQSSSTVLDELDTLREENRKLKDTVTNISFNDNPDIFQINRNANSQTEMFLDNVTAMEASSILKSNVNEKQHVEIAWRVLNE